MRMTQPMSRVAAPIVAGSRRGPIVIVVAIASLVYFLDALVHSIMGPLAPDVARSLHLSKADLGPVFSANLAGQCVGLILFPLCARRIGHRRTTALTLAGFGIFQAMTAYAMSGESLICLRLVTGFFLGGSLPSAFALAAEAAPRERQGLALTIVFTGYGLGSAAAGVLASLFPGEGGWRPAMEWVGAGWLASAALAWLFLPRTPVVAGSARPEPGAVDDRILALLS